MTEIPSIPSVLLELIEKYLQQKKKYRIYSSVN